MRVLQTPLDPPPLVQRDHVADGGGEEHAVHVEGGVGAGPALLVDVVVLEAVRDDAVLEAEDEGDGGADGVDGHADLVEARGRRGELAAQVHFDEEPVEDDAQGEGEGEDDGREGPVVEVDDAVPDVGAGFLQGDDDRQPFRRDVVDPAADLVVEVVGFVAQLRQTDVFLFDVVGGFGRVDVVVVVRGVQVHAEVHGGQGRLGVELQGDARAQPGDFEADFR